MLQPSFVPRLVARQAQLSNILIGCMKVQPCRNYSNRFILKKLQPLSFVEQHKDLSSVSSCLNRSQQCPGFLLHKHHQSLLTLSGRQTCVIQQTGFSTGPGDPSQEPTKGLNKEKISTRTVREPFLGKEILRKIKKKQTEQYFIYTGNNLMDVQTAMQDYLLERSDIDKLITFKRTSPYSHSGDLTSKEEEKYIECAWTNDIEKLAIDKWGSFELLEKEKMLRQIRGSLEDQGRLGNKDHPLREKIKEAFFKDSGSVVMVALVMNMCNASFKGYLWYVTGSPSMFSEFMHSLVDTFNQILLAFGRYLSLQKPDAMHPYGYRNHIHIWSILSGVIIFSLGCGFTAHNAIQSLWHPVMIDSYQLKLSLAVLVGSFGTEAASLGYACLEIRKKAMAAGMSMWSYVKDGDDPLCNVVLMEDTAGVIGVLICFAAMFGQYSLGMPQLDAIGSFFISGMLGAVSLFLLKSNMDKLVGKAIPYEDKIIEELEKDRFVHAVWDHKSQDFGDQSRFKTEVVLDARLMTRHYLDTEVDVDAMFVKWMSVKTAEDMTLFLEDFGNDFYNQIVAHVDRKERDIKRKFPEIRHIDIEPS